jgi:hypothetical protein
MRNCSDEGGIISESRDIKLNIYFKEESKLLDFQSAVRTDLRLTARKRKGIEQNSGVEETLASNEEDRFNIQILNENVLTFTVDSSNSFIRIFAENYHRNPNDKNGFNSPLCDFASYSTSIFSYEVVSLNEAEVRAQMIEDVSCMFLYGQSPEVCHIKEIRVSACLRKKKM